MTKTIIDPEPDPIPNDQPAIWEIVIGDMQSRNTFGKKKYGTFLQPFNGRDMLVDAYGELLDLIVYLRGHIYERDILIAMTREEHVTQCSCGGDLEVVCSKCKKIMTD